MTFFFFALYILKMLYYADLFVRSDKRGRNSPVFEFALSVLSRSLESDSVGQRPASQRTQSPLPGRLPAPLYMVTDILRNLEGINTGK